MPPLTFVPVAYLIAFILMVYFYQRAGRTP